MEPALAIAVTSFLLGSPKTLHGIHEIGAAAFRLLTGKKEPVPNYFDEVYKTISKIVGRTIDQKEIDEINGRINGLRNWVNNVYLPRLEASRPNVDKRELFDLIKEKEYRCAELISILCTETYAKPAFKVFQIAAGMHFALLQELATVDPSVSNPAHSSYTESIKRYADEYERFLIHTYESIKMQRTDERTITPVQMRLVNPPSSLLTRTYEDKHLGVTKKPRNQSRDDYIQRVQTDLAYSLGDPERLAKLWRQLKEQPLGTAN